eukprot:2948915-Rhodomonas_salina.2
MKAGEGDGGDENEKGKCSVAHEKVSLQQTCAGAPALGVIFSAAASRNSSCSGLMNIFNALCCPFLSPSTVKHAAHTQGSWRHRHRLKVAVCSANGGIVQKTRARVDPAPRRTSRQLGQAWRERPRHSDTRQPARGKHAKVAILETGSQNRATDLVAGWGGQDSSG